MPPLVTVAPAVTARFAETIEAVGTGVANEQVTLSAPVTERIVRLGFDDGSFVRAGQVVAVLAQGQENAQLAEAQARAREAGQQLERVTELKERGFATRSNYEAQEATAAAAKAQAAQARATVGDRVITAPFAGWVSLRNISPGAIVSAGTEIATISDIRTIKLDFPVPETSLSAIRPGQTIVARAAAYPDQPFRGQIANIDTVVDPNTRAVTVRAHLPNPDAKLKPGMLLAVTIETASRVAVGVPELAVIGQGDSRFVYVLGRDGTVKRTEVRTGLRSEGKIEIVEGLRPGQRIVTEGVAKLSDGMKVRLAAAAAPRPVGKQMPAAGG
ncbi:efflux RND transporter periplasmic adaptor subunit [Sphingosinicella sp. GR2756]|uniref:Efflux RND transporter periplasmic adaptor subunit n=2 Tax=Sphingosinicella rhizophila TaxID=3050082 RepID=A0ABU3Q499_9SPHN|nr:efflux RND transporter periplasmic adaptor subunit [Sphingosinicella sp. GR2756]MDT9598251.1 efflux RND transporter periplasmic adaptor subunit [Sphingosinicella sp. GR2756]